MHLTRRWAPAQPSAGNLPRASSWGRACRPVPSAKRALPGRASSPTPSQAPPQYSSPTSLTHIANRTPTASTPSAPLSPMHSSARYKKLPACGQPAVCEKRPLQTLAELCFHFKGIATTVLIRVNQCPGDCRILGNNR